MIIKLHSEVFIGPYVMDTRRKVTKMTEKFRAADVIPFIDYDEITRLIVEVSLTTFESLSPVLELLIKPYLFS